MNNKFAFEAPPYKYTLQFLTSAHPFTRAEAFENGESIWTHETLCETKSTDAAFLLQRSSNMTLNPVSALHKLIQASDPMGAFQSRTKNFKLFIDKTNTDSLLTFKLNYVGTKDGHPDFDISGNTVNSPYLFSFNAPRLSEMLNIPGNPVTVTVNILENTEEKTKAECLVEYFLFRSGDGVDQRSLSISLDSTSLPWKSLQKTKIEMISSGDRLLRTEVTLRGTTSKGEFQGWFEVSGRSKETFGGEFDKEKLTVIPPFITVPFYQAPFRFEINPRDVNQAVSHISRRVLSKAVRFLFVNQYLLEQWWFGKFVLLAAAG